MNSFKRGTPACGLFVGSAFVLIAGLIMWLGFWRTLLLTVLFALGYFLGSVKDKAGFVKEAVDKVIPDKKNNAGEVVDFRREVEQEQASRFSADQAHGKTEEEKE